MTDLENFRAEKDDFFASHPQSPLTALQKRTFEGLRYFDEDSSLRLEISGHTDSDGGAAVNQPLSEARANAVRDHLVGQGIAADRLSAVGYGDTKPVAANDSESNKALNRRTEITVL